MVRIKRVDFSCNKLFIVIFIERKKKDSFCGGFAAIVICVKIEMFWQTADDIGRFLRGYRRVLLGNVSTSKLADKAGKAWERSRTDGLIRAGDWLGSHDVTWCSVRMMERSYPNAWRMRANGVAPSGLFIFNSLPLLLLHKALFDWASPPSFRRSDGATFVGRQKTRRAAYERTFFTLIKIIAVLLYL